MACSRGQGAFALRPNSRLNHSPSVGLPVGINRETLHSFHCPSDDLSLLYKRLCVNKMRGRGRTRVLLSACLQKRADPPPSTRATEVLFDQFLCLFSSVANMLTHFSRHFFIDRYATVSSHYLQSLPLRISDSLQAVERTSP
jgi:hypothetical protein